MNLERDGRGLVLRSPSTLYWAVFRVSLSQVCPSLCAKTQVNCGDVVGQSPYHSKVSKREEYQPVSMMLLGAASKSNFGDRSAMLKVSRNG